ncbi:pyruvate-flavodoxin oxidoreductase [Alphaproteobacteria bacterium]|nr:pyruvate-flavodoxin oxidoreductase [Alphaproteobacteria bacterium]
MADGKMRMMDGNEAAASVAHRLSEVVALYPITPSSPMGEFSEAWAAGGVKNIWGKVPEITEMQSEAGAIAAVHGALQAGSLATTFTASQGLLLMIPGLYKIAGELTPFVVHVAARTVAAHALSIFGDHSDVMACRQTGFAQLASSNVQEAHDFAAVAHMATLRSRVPFMHFFDGFRTSHELNKVEYIDDDGLRALMDGLDPLAVAKASLNPERPVVRGTAQNPDVFFQLREAANPFYDSVAGHVRWALERLAATTGRKYGLVDYEGAADAEKVIVVMGSGAETCRETVRELASKGQKVGVVTVRLYRPFPTADLLAALPKSVKVVSVLDRTKEAGSLGEPLYLDTVAALKEAGRTDIKVQGGRYGLSSKEFTPAMVKAVLDNKDKTEFTVGIEDDQTHLSLSYDPHFTLEHKGVVSAVFYGLGSDGTVGANKNSIKIIAGDGDAYGQAYFVYDSKKAGAMTASHLRFCHDAPIKAPYLVERAGFVACHHFPFIFKVDMLAVAAEGAAFLINAPFHTAQVWDSLPREVQETIIRKKLKVYAIDAVHVAEKTGMGRRINTIMQTCFFAISGVMTRQEGIERIKAAIKKTYARKGEEVVKKNFVAVDTALEYLHEVAYPATATSDLRMQPGVPADAPEFLRSVTGKIIEGKGDSLTVAALAPTADGTWPSDTAKYEKRSIAVNIPVWDPVLCIQCGKCSLVCPHGCLRAKVADSGAEADGLAFADYKGKDFAGKSFAVQVSPADCTGCSLCAEVCPAKDKENPARKAIAMMDTEQAGEAETRKYARFLALPDVSAADCAPTSVKAVQFMRPLFEFSGACAGCGETPYIKLATQLFGDRMVVANATGCSSIYGGNLPTTPYAKNAAGRGPAWANSLFEDNAEFGLGIRCSLDAQRAEAAQLLAELEGDLGADAVKPVLENAGAREPQCVAAQQKRVADLHGKLGRLAGAKAARLNAIIDSMVDRSVWIIGGDGWAYDIGYGGLDHVLYSGRNVNVLVLDTGVYSNTGGQMSKATPVGASAKFAVAGKELPRKDLGAIAMVSGNVYVASVSLGASDAQLIKAFAEAESFDGPSLIIAYSHCISHGYELEQGLAHQKLAVETGFWPLYRYDPRLKAEGKEPMQLDSKAPSKPIGEFVATENRFKIIASTDKARYERLLAEHQKAVDERRKYYERLAGL